MKQVTHHSSETYKGAGAPSFPPLEAVTSPVVDTAAAAYYINRRPQTLRVWAMRSGSGPIAPLRICGRLAWKVADLKKLVGVA